MGKRPTSPTAKDKELHYTTGKRTPSPPAQDLHLHPSTKQPELLLSTDRESQPLPSTQQQVYATAKDSLCIGFFVSRQKVQNIDKNACKQIFEALEPLKKEVEVDEPSKDFVTAVSKFFSCYKKYQHKEPLKDLGVLVEEFWEDSDKDYNEFEYGKLLVTKKSHAKLL
jgi:hypothetical protein